MTQSLPPSPRPTPSPKLVELLTRLRAEQAASSPQAKSLISHELGAALEQGEDEGAATREYLQAFNAEPRFREPLEGLLRILERRPPTKSAGKLLDALVKVAESPEEKARALCKRGALLLDLAKDEAGARLSFEAASREAPEDPTAWLELEILAGKQGDEVERLRALEARSRLSRDPSWRGLLLIDRADLESRRGNADAAREHLQTASELEGIARFPALRALEALALAGADTKQLAASLEAQAELAEGALADASRGDSFGVPHEVRKPEAVADLWLRTAEALRLLGEPDRAAVLIERATRLLPDHDAAMWLEIALAQARGDSARAAEMARARIEAGATGASAAALWLQIAEAAAKASDPATALEAAHRALEIDPASLPAGELRLELLRDSADRVDFARGLTARADDFPTIDAKAQAHLLAAYVHAIEARDVEGAKASLARAASCGVPSEILARTARLFAAVLVDDAWYEAATSELADARGEQPSSLAFELARLRLKSGDFQGAREAARSLAASSEGSSLHRYFAAYGLAALRDPDGAFPQESVEAIAELAKRENDPRVAQALTVVAAARADGRGDLDGARARLRELWEAKPGDDLVALVLADLERRSERPLEAARVLARAAATAEDAELASALHVEAFVLASRAGDVAMALGELESARAGSPTAISSMLAWALRKAAPARGNELRQVLEIAENAGEPSEGVALERAALAIFDSDATDLAEAHSALDGLEAHGSGALLVACALARLLSNDDDVEARERALDRIATLSPKGTALAASERLRLARAQGNREAAAEAARLFAESDATLASAIEWLGEASASEDRDAEALVRRRIATALGGEDGAAIEASASAVALAHSPAGELPMLEPTQTASRLMNLELAPLGSAPGRRAQALAGLDDALGVDVQTDALLLAGFNHLASGHAAGALFAFQQVTEARPDEPWAWEGIRAAAQTLDDPRSFAIACAHLGELCQDDARGAELWEQAGLVLLDRLREPRQAELALEQAFTRDPTRAVAFDRLFRHVRDSGHHDKLLSLITRRLEVTENPDELAKLFWEQARALRQKGNREEALAALESVTALEPDHIGALALSGEIFIAQGQHARAAQSLARLATLDSAPDKQRLMSGVAAVDLYENKLGDSIRALEVLVGLHEAGLSNLPVRERLARAAAKTESWRHAASIFEELMNDRPTREGRIEAARLAMVLWRDKLDMPAKAERATAKLLAESPGDAEAIDVLLESPFDPAVKRSLLLGSRDALVRALVAQPLHPDNVARLSVVAAGLSDLPLRQASLGARVALGCAEPGTDAELADLDERVARTPRIALDEATLARIADPEDAGSIARLFQTISVHVAEALGPSLAALGVGKKERLDPRAGFPVRNEVAAWAGALGMGEVDVYIGGPDPEGVQGIASDPPALVIGTSIRSPLSPKHRQAIARELFALHRGTGVTRTRDETTVAALVVATCNLAEVPIDAPPYAILGDIQRQLGKALSRKTKKLLPSLCREIVASGQDPKRWARAAQLSMYRIATIAAGDVSHVLADVLDQPRRQLSLSRDERAHRLLAFVLSPDYLELRERLGMGIQ